MVVPTADEVYEAASQIAFGRPIVQNNFRAIVFEAIVECALKTGWSRCSGDWKGWDFEHRTGKRLEVKQSALRQTWKPPYSPRSPRFDIAVHSGSYEGAVWTPHYGRNADIYVFGLHPVVDDTADHRDAAQWRFYVTPSSKLPPAKTIGLAALNKLSTAVTWEFLSKTVEKELLAL